MATRFSAMWMTLDWRGSWHRGGLYTHGEVSHNVCISGHYPQPAGEENSLVRARRALSPGRSESTDPSTIRAFFLAPMIRELGNSAVPIDSFLRRYGLCAAQLTSLYERVPLRHFVALAEDA
ncbi:MAG TPA: hypothetical protein VHB68_17430, partial [Steroidobacteraceae bacterium]|nr:hypothetical protein [Steroidobacteraceae bacterium]